jgi:8-oxo-dGTP diphosphatase
MAEREPKVGVGVLIFKDGKILLGARKSSHGAGEFAGPGGHLEFGETFEECAMRETREETGIEITNLRVICLSNLLMWEGKHYVDIGIVADWKSGEPQLCEPEKCDGWDWYDSEKLPPTAFKNVGLYLAALKSGHVYSGTHR